MSHLKPSLVNFCSYKALPPMVCNEGTAVRLRNQIVSKVMNLFSLKTKINCLLLVFTIKEGKSGTSLVVQWLRLYAPNAGGMGLIPGQRTRADILQLRPSAAE